MVLAKISPFNWLGRGLNLVLVGRNPNKLKDVSDSIQAKYGKNPDHECCYGFPC